MERFLIIGSNSFSGAYFCSYLLDREIEVYGVSRSQEPHSAFLPHKWSGESKNYKFKKLDINKDLNEVLNLVRDFKPNFIVNFAAQGMVAESWITPEDWYQTNVVSQVKLHNELRKIKDLKKYVHVSTPEAYGSTDGGWLKENYHFAPSTPYAVSRAACDLHLLSFFRAYNFPVVFTRAANVYGPAQQLYRIIPKTMILARTEGKLELHGGGHSVRSFIHMHDVCEATLKITLEGKPGSTYHISTNETISIRSLVNTICKMTNVKFDELVIETDDRLGKDQSYLLDSNKIREELEWQDVIPIKEGLEETLSWVDNNLSSLKDLPFEYIHKK